MQPLTVTGDLVDRAWTEDNQAHGTDTLARVPPRYAEAAADHPEVRTWCVQLLAEAARTAYTGNPVVKRGGSLAILGSVGTGKTHQAYGAVRELATSGAQLRWEFVTAADLYAQLRPSSGVHGEAAYRRYAHAPLLVLDDVGAAKSSEWVEEINYRIINHRYENRLATVITTNLAPRDLTAGLGERVASRIVEMCSRVVLEGPDRRRPQ
ncbi:ATP-binding protein [Amycolatopsis echigonensis]|uniref:ATP-binding protein n=1 Tax=Amycolatopsis echigonensis TaxID=2576905 RepID=A0A8E1W3B8_9PSEU|nr:ATP-binding protein [Amycolatopsis echigonensis]MBB2502932.1 ATP-binding protein [Amycolatopsis echigonensis]